VIDYCILEAIILKVRKEDNDAEKNMEKTKWKRDEEAMARLKAGETSSMPEQPVGLELEKF
jgi:hypothetical protein